MQSWTILLILSLSLVFYNYAGYAIIAGFFNLFGRKNSKDPGTSLRSGSSGKAGASAGSAESEASEEPESLPTVSFIVAAYNEAGLIEKKILNSFDQDYSAGKIEFIFVTDGSSDATPTVVGRYPQVRLLHHPERNGKSAAVNRAVDAASNEILIFSDANTMLNRMAIRNIVRHYADERTGGVAGEKKVIALDSASDETGQGEGLYWKYESFLKRVDADFYSVVGAAGELFSVRRRLYRHLSPDVVLDDFVLSLQVAQEGYRIAYEPEAYAMELPSFSLKDERKRKVRIAAGGFQSIGILWRLLLFWRYPRLSFLYISHRVLRWAVSPFCLVLALVSNIALCYLTLQMPTSTGQTSLDALPQNFSLAPGARLAQICWFSLLILQLLFYGLAALASLQPPERRSSLTKLPYYFTFMNVSVILGFFRFLRGGQSGVWEKAKRADADGALPLPK